jgi:hypothetical protein
MAEKKKTHKIYKIKDKTTGLFSKGGTQPLGIWTKEGKSWSNIGHLKSHINQFINKGVKTVHYPYDNAEMVEIEVNYDECFKMDVDEMTAKLIKSKKEAEAEYAIRMKAWKEEKERELLKSLKTKYEA